MKKRGRRIDRRKEEEEEEKEEETNKTKKSSFRPTRPPFWSAPVDRFQLHSVQSIQYLEGIDDFNLISILIKSSIRKLPWNSGLISRSVWQHGSRTEPRPPSANGRNPTAPRISTWHSHPIPRQINSNNPGTHRQTNKERALIIIAWS